ncbi:MAG TPA: molybdopterin cofactor-binding domain-containing protein, partial [Micromonosporaceae bacterium]
EEVAAVAAETLAEARTAARRIDVRYQRLSAATSVAAARDQRAERIHERASGNVALAFSQSFGEAAPDRRPDASVTGTYRFPRQSHACMETNTIVARWDAAAGQLEVWASSQAPHFTQKELAHVLDLDEDSVVVHQVAVGGGFGSKSKISEYEAIAAALSMKTGRPVRLALTRAEEFATTKSRHRFEIDMTTSATADGLLCSRHASIVVENGAYNHSGPSVMGAASGAIASLYRVPEVSYDAALVYTNTHPGGQFRGYGNPQATFAMESQMDELAERIGMDPVEFRLRNVNESGDVTHAGYRLGSADLRGCLETARDAIGWAAKRADGGHGRGVGIAGAIQVSGAYVYPNANRSSAGIDVGPDGRVTVRFGGADAGTGQRTLLAQIAASELGVALEQVDVLMMESHQTPPDHGAWSSRGTYMGGHAVRRAALAAAAALRERTAELTGVAAPSVLLAEGQAIADGTSLPLGQVVERTAPAWGPLTVTEEYVADVEELDHHTGRGNISGAYSFAAQAVEVEVDLRTGKVRVCQVVAAHDSGVIVNPLLAESQVAGGVAMGIGVALGEELIYHNGRAVNPTYMNYPLPRAADTPPIRAIFRPAVDPNGPYGAKGLGEIVIVPTAAAVANAVAHAIGVRIRDLPITPDKVLDALRMADGVPPRRYHLWRRPPRWGIEAMRRAYPNGGFALLERLGGRSTPAPPAGQAALEEPRDLVGVRTALRADGAVPLAGGTDLLTAHRQGLRDAATLVDLRLVPDLARIEQHSDGGWRIGAAVRLAELEHAVPDGGPAGALAQTVATIASAQVREMATVGGNLCQQNRCWFYRNDFPCYQRSGPAHPCYAVDGDHRFYHAAMDAHRCQAVTPSDLATTLSALDAVVLLDGPRGQRSTPVASLYSGPGQTVLRSDEIVVAVEVPAAAGPRHTEFAKLSMWSGDFAMVSACSSIRVRAGTITEARIVLGAIAPTPIRLRRVERALVRAGTVTPDELASIARTWTRQAHPLRGNAWKVDAATGLIRTTLERCLRIAGGRDR